MIPNKCHKILFRLANYREYQYDINLGQALTYVPKTCGRKCISHKRHLENSNFCLAEAGRFGFSQTLYTTKLLFNIWNWGLIWLLKVGLMLFGSFCNRDNLLVLLN